MGCAVAPPAHRPWKANRDSNIAGTTGCIAVSFLSAAHGYLNNFASGVSWGGIDEIYGINSEVNKRAGELLGLDNYASSPGYDEARQDFHDRQAEFNEQHPWSSLGMEVLGGLTSGIPGAAKAAAPRMIKPAWNVLGPWMKRGIIGAGGGGLSGWLYGEPGERGDAAKLGAKIGGPLGIVAPPLIGLAKKGWDATGGKLLHFGANRAQDLETQAYGRIGQMFDDDGIPLKQAEDMMAAGPDSMVIADLGEDAVLQAADTGVQRGGREATQATNMLKQRALEQHSDINSLIGKYIGTEKTFTESLNSLKGQLKTKAKPYYDKAIETPVQITNDLRDILRTPPGNKALQKALEISRTKMDDISDHFIYEMKKSDMPGDVADGVFRYPKEPDSARRIIGIKDGAPLKVWDYVKRGLDRAIFKETDSITGQVSDDGRDILILKKQLLSGKFDDAGNQLSKGLDDISSDYKTARSIYGGTKKSEEALRMGRNYLSKKFDPEDIAGLVQGMSDAERQYFRAGVVRSVKDQLSDINVGADGYKKIFGKGSQRDRLRIAFKNEDDFNQFADEMNQRWRMRRTENKVQGQSATARRQQELATSGEISETGAYYAGRGDWMGWWGTMLRDMASAANKPNAQLNDVMTNMWFNPSKQDSLRILKEMQKMGHDPSAVKRMINQQVNQWAPWMKGGNSLFGSPQSGVPGSVLMGQPTGKIVEE